MEEILNKKEKKLLVRLKHMKHSSINDIFGDRVDAKYSARPKEDKKKKTTNLAKYRDHIKGY